MSIAQKQVTTICKDCVFATFQDKVQSGCELNRLDIFRKTNNVNQLNDADGSHFVIDRYCNACRHKDSDWAERYGPIKHERINTETRLRLSFVVFSDTDLIPNTEFGWSLESQLTQIAKQSFPPAEVHVLNNNKNDHQQASNICDKVFEPLGIKYTITTNISGESKTPNKMFDEIIGKITGNYFTVLNLPYILPIHFVEKLNDAYQRRVEEFSMIRPCKHTGQGLTIWTALAKLLNGNSKSNTADGLEIEGLPTKIEYLADVHDQKHLIREMADFLNV